MLIHTEKLRWLFWLRWKLLLRGFARDRWRIVGTIFLFIFVLSIAGSVAAGTFFAYRFLPFPANLEVLFLVLTGAYLLWIVLPLLEYSVNEGLDISKLTSYPLTRAELMASLLFSTPFSRHHVTSCSSLFLVDRDSCILLTTYVPEPIPPTCNGCLLVWRPVPFNRPYWAIGG